MQIFTSARTAILILLAPAPALALQGYQVSAPEPAQGAAGVVRLREHTFHDKGVRNMASHKVLVPAGWKAEGGAFWAPQTCFQVFPSQNISISSEDGLMVRIEPSFLAKDFVFPSEYGMPRPPAGSVDSGFPILHLPRDLQAWDQWLRSELIPAEYPAAKNIRVRGEIVPELTAQLRQRNLPMKRQLEASNGYGYGSGRVTFDSSVLAFECRYELGGVSYEELRLVVLQSNVHESAEMGWSALWGVERGFTYRAKEGQLAKAMPLLKAIADSVRTTDEWLRMKAEMTAKILKISHQVAMDNIAAARERSNIIAQTGNEIRGIMEQGRRERERMEDRGHARVIEGILGTATYTPEGGGEAVSLPSGYDHVYSNGQGEFLLTSNALFSPGVDLEPDGSTWTKMKQRR